MPPKPSKYRSKKVITDEGVFDSQAEYRRWCELKILHRVGEITDLQRQIPFFFEEGGKTVFKYIADFVYVKSGERVVEDVKGVRTPLFRLKKKLIEARHGIHIDEVGGR